jgi:transmembrane sensor
MSNNSDIDLLVSELIDCRITKENLKVLQAWTEASGYNKEYVRKSIQAQIAAGTIADDTPFDHEQAIKRFYQHIGQQAGINAGKSNNCPTIRSHRTMPLWILKVAAAVILVLIVISWGAFHMGTNAVKSDFAQVKIEAPRGSQLNLTLPDGTFVKLNSGTTLSYSQGFGITDRTVIMDGEGYFEVEHNMKLPFSVKTDELIVNDIGTKFSFRNFKEDTEACVELFEGKVSLNNTVRNENNCDMVPGERIVMDKQSGALTKTPTTTSIMEAQKMSKLVFENMTVAEIAHILSRNYDVPIVILGNIGNIRFYGSFDKKSNSLADILNAMATTKQINYKVENGKYILY